MVEVADDSLDGLISRNPAFAAAVRGFKVRLIWSLVAGASAIVGLVPVAHWISSWLYQVFPRVPVWAWQWGFVVTGVAGLWVAFSVPAIFVRMLFPSRERRFLEVDLSTGIAINELRIAGIRRPNFSPPAGRLMVEVTDRPDALHGYRYDDVRGIFFPATVSLPAGGPERMPGPEHDRESG